MLRGILCLSLKGSSMLRQGDAKPLVSNFGIDFYLGILGVDGGGDCCFAICFTRM